MDGSGETKIKRMTNTSGKSCSINIDKNNKNSKLQDESDKASVFTHRN